jgi:hypothetical protein
MIAKNQWRINKLQNASPLISNAELVMGSLKALSLHPHSVLPVGSLNSSRDIKLFEESRNVLPETHASKFPFGSFSARISKLNK